MIKSFLAHLTADKMLGVAGGGLAVSSMGFGLYMNLHGPVSSFGQSQYFTVYAQLVGHRPPKEKQERPVPAVPDEGLDMTATASIAPQDAAPKSPVDLAIAQANAAIIRSVTLETVGTDSAIVSTAGRIQTIHVGDHMPEAGEVLQILAGPRPAVKTSRGFIVTAR